MKKIRKITAVILILATVLTTVGYSANSSTEAYAKGNEKKQTTEWMLDIRDDTSLSSITIPGTHASGAQYIFPGFFLKCQSQSVSDQLVNGFRFLDFRLGVEKNDNGDKLRFVYDNGVCRSKFFIFSKKLYFADVIEQVYAFLDAHPSETVIITIKDEDNEDNSPEFESLLFKEINENKDKWYLKNDIPTLGSVRGKIVLGRRFEDSNLEGNCGLNFMWDDQGGTDAVDLPYASMMINSSCQLWVQDRYNYTTEAKTDAYKEMLEDCQADDSTFLINFLSTRGSGWFRHPKHYAKYINKDLMSTTLYPQTSYGVIAVDFGTRKIAQHIYMSNFTAQEAEEEE